MRGRVLHNYPTLNCKKGGLLLAGLTSLGQSGWQRSHVMFDPLTRQMSFRLSCTWRQWAKYFLAFGIKQSHINEIYQWHWCQHQALCAPHSLPLSQSGKHQTHLWYCWYNQFENIGGISLAPCLFGGCPFIFILRSDKILCFTKTWECAIFQSCTQVQSFL